MRLMTRRVLLWATLVALVGTIGLSGQTAPAVRVLFIGNSYTYFNNLPDMFRGLAAADHRPVEVRMVAPGGWRLRDHLDKGETRKALAEGKWDYVVLQDQSTLGVNYYVDGQVRVAGDQVFRPAADQWIDEIRKAGANPLLYLTWAREATPGDQAALTYAYMSAARSGKAMVAPVGIAWSRVRRSHPAIGLYFTDGSHPSPAGTYLAACSMFAAIFDRNPEGLPGVVEGRPVNLDTEQVIQDRIASLASLPDSDARALQSAAWNAWQELKRAGGYLEVSPPPLPVPEPLPAGIRVAAASLEGRWEGTLRFHPSGPADMALTLRRFDGRWSGEFDLKFAAKDIASETTAVVDLRVGEDGIRFASAASAAVAGLRIEFHGVNESAAQMRGTATAARGTEGPPLRLVGTWVLKKVR